MNMNDIAQIVIVGIAILFTAWLVHISSFPIPPSYALILGYFGGILIGWRLSK